MKIDLQNTHVSSVDDNANINLQKSEDFCKSDLPAEWYNIDYTEIKKIGFGIPQLRQLYNKGITSADIVQTSINHFTFVMENKPEKLEKYSDKLATLMSVLYKGGSWIDSDCMSPQEIAFQQIAIQRKSRIEKLKKLEKSFFDSEFSLWKANLTDKQKDKILPKMSKSSVLSSSTHEQIELINYFKKHVWKNKMPKELKEIQDELR